MENYNLDPFFHKYIKLNTNCLENNILNKEDYNNNINQNEEHYTFTINENYYYNDSTFDGIGFNFNDTISLSLPHISEIQKVPEIKFLLRKKLKPGARKKNKDNQINKNKKPYTHTKKKFDNILTKIQVSYVNFLIDFINRIIELLYGRKDLKFRYLDSKIKKNNKSDIRKQQKEGSIGDIIKNKIAEKYSTLNKDTNILIYKELKRSGLYDDILNILDQKFLFFFDKIYYNNKRKFNLKDFGLIDLEVDLPENIKLYENLSTKNIGDADYEEYKIKMEKCVKWHFLGGLEEDEINKAIKL